MDEQELASRGQQQKKKGSRQRKQLMQRPGGRTQQGWLEQLKGGQCGQRSGESMREGLGEVGEACRFQVGFISELGLYPGEMRRHEGF